MEEETYSYRWQNLFCPYLGWFKLCRVKQRGAACLSVCFAMGIQLLKQLVISEKLNRSSKYNCEKAIIHAHIN